MSDNEIKILKSNTFEQWRQKSNQLSMNVGSDDLLDTARLTDKVFTYSNVQGTSRSVIIGGDDDGNNLHLHTIADSNITNSAGTIILAKNTTIPSTFTSGTAMTQGATYTGIIEYVTIMDGRPKIAVSNSTGTFDPSLPLTVAGSSIVANDIIRLVVESYPLCKARVTLNGTESPQGLLGGGFHTPLVSANILTDGLASQIDELVNGTIIYQGSWYNSLTSILANATWYGTVYHANDNTIYLKTYGGSGSFASADVKIYDPSDASSGAVTSISQANITSFSLYSDADDSAIAVEFNGILTAGTQVKIIATDLVSAVNEVQDDIGEITNLQTTDTTDVVNAINELEVAARGSTLANYTLGTDSADGLVGGVNELENIIRDATSEVTNYAIQTDAHNIIAAIDELEEAARGTSLANYTLNTDSADGLVGGVNELELAARGDRSATNYTVSTNSTEGLVGGVNELDTAARGTSNDLVSDILSTEAKNLAAAINELDDQIGTADNTAAIAFSGGPAAAASNTNLLDGVNTIDAKIGQVDITDIVDAESTITGAIAQLHDEVGDVTATNLGTAASNLTAAIREHEDQLGALSWTGTDTTLATANPLTVTSALNALDAELGDTDSYNDGYYGNSTVAGTLDKLQAGMISNDTEIHNLMELIDGERPGTIFVEDGTSITAFTQGSAVHQNDGVSDTFNATVVSSGNNKILVKDITGTFNPAEILYLTGSANQIAAANLIRIAGVDTSVQLAGINSTTIKGSLEELAARSITAGQGMTGGGNLNTSRELSVSLSPVAPGLEFSTNTTTSISVGEANFNTYVAAFEADSNGDKVPTGSGAPVTTPTVTLADGRMSFNGDETEITIAPNISLFADDYSDSGLSGRNTDGTDGDMFLETTFYVQNTDMVGQNVTLTGTVAHTTNDLDDRYSLVAFVKYLSNDGNFFLLGESTTVINTDSSASDQEFTVSLQIPNEDVLPQIGFTLSGLNTNENNTSDYDHGLVVTNLLASYSSSAGAGGLTVNDTVLRTTTAAKTQTINQSFVFTNPDNQNPRVFEFRDGATLDIRNGSLLIGGGSGSFDIDTAFIKFASTNQVEGIEIDRSQINITAGGHTEVQYPAEDARLVYRETKLISGAGQTEVYPSTTSEYDRAWTIDYLAPNADGTVWATTTTPIVTFDNAKHLVENSTQSGITVAWDANSTQFTFDVNDPVISLSGAVAGNATMSNLGDTTITVAQQNDSVALGTHTTGNYMSGISGTTNEIAVTHTAGEGSSATIGLPQDVKISNTLEIEGTTNASITDEGDEGEVTAASFKTAGGAIIGDDLIIRGNLYVREDFVTVSTQQISIGDNEVVLNADLANNVAPITDDSGITVKRGQYTQARLFWDENDNKWKASFPGDDANAEVAYEVITENTDYDTWSLDVNSSGSATTINNTDTVDFIEGSFTAGTGEDADVINDNGIIELSQNGSDVYIEHKAFSASTSTNAGTNTAITGITLDQGHITNIESYDFDNRYMRSFTVVDDNGDTVNISQAKEWKFIEGAGDGASIDIDWTDITPGTTADPFDLTFTVTNTDKGSSQLIYGTVATDIADDGSYSWTTDADVSMTADGNTDTLYIVAGDSIKISGDATNKAIRIAHANTSNANGTLGATADNQFISSVTVEANGHVTGVNTNTVVHQTTLDITNDAEKRDGAAGEIYGYATEDSSTEITNADTYAWVNQACSQYDPQLQFNDSATGLYFTSTGQSLGSATLTNAAVFDHNTVQLVALTENTRTYTGSSDTYKSVKAGISIIGEFGIDYVTPGDHRFYSGSNFSDVVSISDGSITLPSNGTVDGVDISALETTVNAIVSDTGIPALTYVAANAATNGGVTLNDNNGTGAATVTAANIRAAIGAGTSSENTEYDFNVLEPTVIESGLFPGSLRILNLVESDSGTGIGDKVYVEGGSLITVTSASGTSNHIRIDCDAELNQNVYANFEIYPNEAIGTSSPGTLVTADPAGHTLTPGSTTDTLHLYSGEGVDLRTTSANNGNSVLFNIFPDQSGVIKKAGYDSTSYWNMPSDNEYQIVFGNEVDFLFLSNGNFHADGNITAYSSTTTSDAKLKENIEKVDGALELVSQLNGVTFNWKRDGKESAGVIAQNVEEVLPSAVSEVEELNGNDTHKVVDYNQLSALFIEAIKELKEENSQLKAAIEELKNINNTK